MTRAWVSLIVACCGACAFSQQPDASADAGREADVFTIALLP
jgi:hypothetical protein